MHFVAGIATGVIYQVTHIADRTEQLSFSEGGQLDRSFLEHTLATTSDFALSDVVAMVVRERGLEYIEYETSLQAIVSHQRRLNELGRSAA